MKSSISNRGESPSDGHHQELLPLGRLSDQTGAWWREVQLHLLPVRYNSSKKYKDFITIGQNLNLNRTDNNNIGTNSAFGGCNPMPLPTIP